MIKISVLLAVYENDDPQHLLEALLSVDRMRPKPYEVVVVTDGSLTPELDGVISLVSSITLLQVHRKAIASGLGWALRSGVELCKGDYILRMDSDDLCRVDRLGVLTAYLDRNPGVDVIGSYVSEFSSSPEASNRVRRVPLQHDAIAAMMPRRCPVNHVSSLIRREAALRAGNYEGGPGFAEDWWLWIRMLNSGAIFANIPIVTVDVRVGNGFISRRRGLKMFRNDLLFAKKAFSEGYISSTDLIIFLISKVVQRFSPAWALTLIYRMLRNKS